MSTCQVMCPHGTTYLLIEGWVHVRGQKNEHEVQVITSGDRYTIGSFWDDASIEYTDKRRVEWDAELKEVRAQQAIQQQEWAELRKKQ